MNTNLNDDDDFAPNPFRSSGQPSDLLGAPQQQFHDPFQPQMYSQQQQQQTAMMMQPDPNSGMTGVLQYPPQQQQQPPPVQPNPVQYLSGQMDTGAVRPEQAKPAAAGGMFSWLLSCFRLEEAAKLFDIDADDIALRLRYSLTQFFQPDHFRLNVLGDEAETTKGPDLYGPFWISMTLVFILGVASNLSDYLHFQRKSDPDAQFDYDITHVLHAMYIVFAFSFGVPTTFWLASSCLGLAGVPWSLWVCCYGYSMAPILAAALVAWWLPFWIWHMFAMSVGVGASCLLVLRNLSTPLIAQEDNHAKAAPLLLCMLGVHAIFLLVLMLTFFKG